MLWRRTPNDSHPDLPAASPRAAVEVLESRRLFHAAAAAEIGVLPDPTGAPLAQINFQPATAPPVGGYLTDSGARLGDRGNGLAYGWTQDLSKRAVVRHSPRSSDPRYDTFVAMPKKAQWNIAVPDGTYLVHIVAGDPKSSGGARCEITAEGRPVLSGKTAKGQRWMDGTAVITVADGLLTIQNGPGAKTNKIDYIDITPTTNAGDGVGAPEPTPEPTPDPTPDPNSTPLPDPGPVPVPDPMPTPVEVQASFPKSISFRSAASAPRDLAESVGAAVNGKLYVLGGFSATLGVNRYYADPRCQVYDPATNKWTALAPMPEPFTHSQGVVVGTQIWFPGAYVGNHPGPGSTHVWVYDTASNKWLRGPDLPVPRGAGAAALVGRTIYFTGGMDRTRTIDEGTTYALNLDNQAAGWVRKADLPNPRNHVAAASLGGYFYVIGGQHGQEDAQVSQREMDRYDPATDTWTKVASLPSGRSHISEGTLVYKGHIVVIGGETASGTPQRTVYAYDPAANRWSQIGTLPARRSTVVAGFINGQLVVTTGNSPGGTKTTWIGKLS